MYTAIALCSEFVHYGIIIFALIGLFVVSQPKWLLISVNSMIAVAVATSAFLLVYTGYETYGALSSESVYERSQLRYQYLGTHAWVYWTILFLTATPQLWWITKLRKSLKLQMALCLVIIVPTFMLFHRYGMTIR